MTSWRPDLFTYLSYRDYMRDYYQEAKAHTRHMSFRYLSQRAGFKSPNFYKLVMEGERNLSEDGAQRVARALDLDAEERAFFLELVAFDQGDRAEQRNAAFERISASQRFRQARRLDHETFEYLSAWYYPTIREMVARPDFREEPEWIAAQLLPPISPKQAARALELLLQLELVTRDESGRLVRQDPTLSTGHEARALQRLAVGNYHRQMLERAAYAIERVPSKERLLGATTMCIDAASFEEIKLRVNQLRELVMELAEQCEVRQRVYQFNIQLFPLSQEAK